MAYIFILICGFSPYAGPAARDAPGCLPGEGRGVRPTAARSLEGPASGRPCMGDRSSPMSSGAERAPIRTPSTFFPHDITPPQRPTSLGVAHGLDRIERRAAGDLEGFGPYIGVAELGWWLPLLLPRERVRERIQSYRSLGIELPNGILAYPGPSWKPSRLPSSGRRQVPRIPPRDLSRGRPDRSGPALPSPSTHDRERARPRPSTGSGRGADLAERRQAPRVPVAVVP